MSWHLGGVAESSNFLQGFLCLHVDLFFFGEKLLLKWNGRQALDHKLSI